MAPSTKDFGVWSLPEDDEDSVPTNVYPVPAHMHHAMPTPTHHFFCSFPTFLPQQKRYALPGKPELQSQQEAEQ
jgi:hypothetical protein